MEALGSPALATFLRCGLVPLVGMIHCRRKLIHDFRVQPMYSLARILLVTLIMTSVLGTAHYYLWRRLVRDAVLPRRAHLILSSLLVALLVSQPAMFLLGRDTPRDLIAPIAFTAFIWMGMLSTYFVLLSATDLTTKVFQCASWVKRRFEPRTSTGLRDPQRRLALGRLMAGGVALSGTAVGGMAIAQALGGFRLEKLEITLEKLPPAFDGFRIVQMTDIHVGPTIGKNFVERIVATANQQDADVIAITGDLVDGSVANLSRDTAPLGELRARYGTFFVTGNHEYYSGADDWIEELARLGIPTLRNDAERIERKGASFLLAGVTDHRAGSYGDPPDLVRALRHRRADEEVVLLAHQPREITRARQQDVGLQLSGHTHGGQFWPWNWVIHLIEPVVRGWARFGRTQIYVNSGTGYWGPPMRSGTEAEITVVTLRSPAPPGAAHPA